MKTAKPPKSASYAPPLPPGTKVAFGSKAHKALQGQKIAPPVELDKSFVSDHRGGPEKVIGRGHIHIKGDPQHKPR
jgi:hypothetical protein